MTTTMGAKTNATLVVAKLEALVEECREEAVREGFDEKRDGEWEPTAGDCDWICDRLPRKPTRQEWREAGWAWVGSNHVCDDEDAEKHDRLMQCASETAADNTIGAEKCTLEQAIRRMRDEPGEVAKVLGFEADDVIEWCEAQMRQEVR